METSASSTKWFSDLVTEDMMIPVVENQYPMDLYVGDYTLDDIDFNPITAENNSLNHEAMPNFSSSSIKTSQPGFTERPMKQLKTASSSSSSQIISFASSASPARPEAENYAGVDLNGLVVKPKTEAMSPDCSFVFPSHRVSHDSSYRMGQNIEDFSRQGQYSNKRHRDGAVSRMPLQAQDHVMAERKRREKLSQRFVSLSAVIPGLKRLDKASVLGEAAKYVKQLQERLKKLEEEASRKTVESVVLVKKSQVATDDGNSSSDESSCDQVDQQLPEIEARASGNHVLIRVHCERRQGCISRILRLMENLNLSVLNSSVVPFGSSILDFTIVAQMDEEFSMTVEDIVRNLRQDLLNII